MMCLEISQRLTLMWSPISGLWMDAMCIVDRAIPGTLTQMCIGYTTKISSELDVLSIRLQTMEMFGFYGLQTLTSEHFCKKTGQRMEISGESFPSDPLNDFSMKGGQPPRACWTIV